MPFTPWACQACKRNGRARHTKAADISAVATLVANAHIIKSPFCAGKNGHKHVAMAIVPKTPRES